MARFQRLVQSEFKRFRTAVPIHLVAVLQPTVMYLLMSVILVHPTFDLYVSRPTNTAGERLVVAMSEVGSPIGLPYIQPVLVDESPGEISRQLVTIEDRGFRKVAVQRFGLVDSNLVKNYRNRLTAADLRLWNEDLDRRAIIIHEHPWLAYDAPYAIYFGLAMLPLTAFMAASMLGAFLTAQEFEFGTIVEYRLSPISGAWVLITRLVRLVLTSYLAAGILTLAIGAATGAWPRAVWRIALVLLPVAIIAGSLGTLAGLVLRRIIPAFIVALISSFAGWLLGSAFGLAAGFGGWYERISRLTPNTHAVELIFPSYLGAGAIASGMTVGQPGRSILALSLMSMALVVLAGLAYRWSVRRQA